MVVENWGIRKELWRGDYGSIAVDDGDFWRVGKKVGKNAKKGLCFLQKFYILKLVDEHPHKQGKI